MLTLPEGPLHSPKPLHLAADCRVLRPSLPLPGSPLQFKGYLMHSAFQEGSGIQQASNASWRGHVGRQQAAVPPTKCLWVICFLLFFMGACGLQEVQLLAE